MAQLNEAAAPQKEFHEEQDAGRYSFFDAVADVGDVGGVDAGEELGDLFGLRVPLDRVSLRVVEHRHNRECRDFAGLLAVPTVKDTAMVTTALKMALWRRDHGGRRVGSGLIHHSDAGRQGGFNLSSQHSAVKPSVSALQALPLGFATHVFCAGGC